MNIFPIVLVGAAMATGCGFSGGPAERPEPGAAKAALETEAGFAAALALAREERPEVDIAAARRRVDALAVEIGREAFGARTARERAEAVAHVFFGRHGYQANPEDRDGKSPDSFDVIRTLATHQGSCLAVSIVIARAASAAGLMAGVVRAPGHAVVAIGPPSERTYLDPAESGRVREWAEIARLRPWSPAAAAIYDGRPLDGNEVLAQLRANRAAHRLAEGKFDRAEADARAALEVVPDLPEALVNLAAVELKRKRPGEARSLLERAHEFLPRNPVVLFNLGLAAAASGDAAEAIAFYEQAIEADPGMESARANKVALEREVEKRRR